MDCIKIKQVRGEIKSSSYAMYVLDGYRRIGFVARWGVADFATSLDPRDIRPFTDEEIMNVHKVLNFHGIAHYVLAVSEIV